MLGDDLEAWMAESSMLRRTFRNVAVIAGLIERNQPGAEKNRRQVTVNSDLIYDVLRRHQPDHILLRATRADAAGGLTDLGRIAGMLARVKGRIAPHGAVARLAARRAGAAGHRPRERAHGRATRTRCWPRPRRIVAEATGEAEPTRPDAAVPRVPAVHRRNAEPRPPAATRSSRCSAAARA